MFTQEQADQVREAFAGTGKEGLSMAELLKVSFGKCPCCSEPLVRGNWLKWCPIRTCDWRTVA